MIVAALAGIRVFVTGGIGGVHREGERSFDISADLTELARTNVAVVCAGAKSILDIGLTLEYLETQGVPVIGYQTPEFPAFYTPSSGFAADCQLDNPEATASMIKAKWDLGLQGGLVIGNPVPDEYAMPKAVIDEAITTALDEAREKGVKGKKVTPFLLERVKQITGGDSLDSNLQLVYNNAKVGAEIAVALEKMYHADLLNPGQ